MNINKVKSFAKINLALHITGKLTKLHKIESVVKFIELHDLITIKKINSKKHHISFNGNFSQNINKNNTVNKLFNILDDRGAISVAQRARYIGRIRDITKTAAGIWLNSQN